MLVLSDDSVCTEIPTWVCVWENPTSQGIEACTGLCVQVVGGWLKSLPAQAGF